MTGPWDRGEPTHVRMFSRDPASGHVKGEPQLALPINTSDVGEIRVYRMTLPFLPPSKNQYDALPWQFQNSTKGKWLRHVIKECEAVMLPKGLRQIGLSAALVFPSNRRRDYQNYAGPLWNFVPDALQKGGFLLGDHAGTIDFGKNLGIKFHVDDRRGVPEIHRKKTHLSIACRIGDGVE